MSADVWTKIIAPLKNEGELVILIQSWREPNATEVDTVRLSESSLFHYPYCHSPFRIKKITDTKTVLFCEGCGLRLSIPGLKTIKELREYLK